MPIQALKQTRLQQPSKPITDDPLDAAASLALAFGGQLVIPPEQSLSDSNVESFWEAAIQLMRATCSNWDKAQPLTIKTPANWYGDAIHDQLIPPLDEGGAVFRFEEPYYFMIRLPNPQHLTSRARVKPDPYGPWTGHWRASYLFMGEDSTGCVGRLLLVFAAASVKALESHPEKVLVVDLLNPSFESVRFELTKEKESSK
jgi:hypothetical protein